MASIQYLNPVEEKRRLRERMRALRLVADQEGADAALALVRHVLPALPELRLEDGAVFAGYWPIATEIDVRPLLARLHDRGFRCALPAIVVGEPVLAFRRWKPTDDLEPGKYDTRQPFATAESVSPQALLVPLLAVDGNGRRLGHGRGWYDRTLAALRACGRVVAIGSAMVCSGSSACLRWPPMKPWTGSSQSDHSTG